MYTRMTGRSKSLTERVRPIAASEAQLTSATGDVASLDVELSIGQFIAGVRSRLSTANAQSRH